MPIDWAQHARVVIEDLGEDAIYTHVGGTPVPGVKVIYTEPYHESVFGAGAVAGSDPLAVGMIADLPDLAQDDVLQIRGVAFSVTAPQPDLVRGTVTMQLGRP